MCINHEFFRICEYVFVFPSRLQKWDIDFNFSRLKNYHGKVIDRKAGEIHKNVKRVKEKLIFYLHGRFFCVEKKGCKSKALARIINIVNTKLSKEK